MTARKPWIARPQVRGIKTNIIFLENVLRHPEFLAGESTTSFIEKNAKDLFKTTPSSNVSDRSAV